ncbi:putative claudin-24 [Periophthalmus magnuspinnatus]|uniref:putative claudin-24 n=1 Tax=Periophthalmus magnuspinnatus TaxID=409849 RepID=UPI00145AABAD|nr:putative claudin-24 [Periophthalmus magnuspinnatus]
MVFLTPKIMQRTALFVTFGGFVTSLMTMFIPFWKTMNSDLNEMENWFSGLFHMCLYTEEVGIQCKAYESILALPMDLQISRVLMSVSIGTGAFAIVMAFLGLEGVEIFQPGLKRGLLIFSGVLTWISGLTTLAPISIVAYTTVVEFWDEGFPDVMPRWEYGEAMFSGWFGGFALVIGGTLFFIAVCMGDFDQSIQTVPGSPLPKQRTQNYLKTEVL